MTPTLKLLVGKGREKKRRSYALTYESIPDRCSRQDRYLWRLDGHYDGDAEVRAQERQTASHVANELMERPDGK